MKKNRLYFITAVLSAVSISMVGCNVNVNVNDNTKHEDTTEEPEYYDEGVDAVCEITGYNDHTVDDGEYFLSEGDKVAVISPSALPSRSQVDATIKGLEEWGFIPVEGQYAYAEVRTIDDIISDFEWALKDPDIKAIFCVRGGYGASEIMDLTSLDMIKEADKPIIGYSDITIYHSAWAVSGLPSLHACMSGTFGDFPLAGYILT